MRAFSFEQTDLFLPLLLGRTARETLQEFIDIDVRSEDLVRILNQNQVYRDLLFRFVNEKTGGKLSEKPKASPTVEKEKTEEKKAAQPPEQRTPTYRTVSLLGMLHTRNNILALRMRRLADGRFPVDEEGKVDLKAGDQLKWALEAEDLFQRNGFEYPETAYAAGVLFDLHKLLARRDEATYKRVEAYYKRTWTRALRTSTIAYLLSQKVESLSPKVALSAGFLIHSGKLPLAAWLQEDSPTYAEFEENIDGNADLPPLARFHLEQQKYGVAFEEVSSHSLRYFDIFKPLVPAVRFFREPYCLAGADPTSHSLTLVLWLADAMARSWKLPANEQDPVIDTWKYPALSLLKISRATLLEVMRKAMSLK